MSYLDVPRLHFVGEFTANPSTINNDIKNYDPANINKIDMSWNPYGSHAWTIGARVTSFLDSAGTLHTAGDPLLGASCNSVANKAAKLVDLDTDQQGRTRLFGLDLEIATASTTPTSLLTAHYQEPSTLLNLWLTKVPSRPEADDTAGGAFQSVLTPLTNASSGSPLLKQLLDASPNGLSIRLSTFGFDDDHTSPTFRRGTIYGTIGPWSQGETRYNAIERMLNPFQPAGEPKSTLWYAPAKLHSERKTLTVDLGNALPDQQRGGPPIDLGNLEVQVDWPSHGWFTLGTIHPADLPTTAGVAEVKLESTGPLSSLFDELIRSTPIRIATQHGRQYLQESNDGRFVEVDGATYYANPGESVQATVCATTFGAPTAGVVVPLGLTPQPDGHGGFTNNVPAGALTFPPSVTTGADGKATFQLAAANPVPKPARRAFVDGQVYFIGGTWASGADSTAGAPLSVKVFNKIEPPIPSPKWTDVRPIFYQYYYLYGYMASIVDMSNYDSIKAKKDDIAYVMGLPDTDPGFMPVTREMSADQRRLILTWIQNGCPQ